MAVQHVDSEGAHVGAQYRSAGRLDATWGPHALGVLRIVAGLLFMEHGLQKWFGFPPRIAPAPELFSLLGVGGILELVGGTLILLGLFTRPAAFLLAGEMAVGYWMFHAPHSFFPAVNGGDAAVLFCFVFLYLVVVGGGSWSLDRAIRKR